MSVAAAARAALSERDFRLLFVARAVSVFGDAVAPVALAFAIVDLTGSASDLGFVLAARTVPFVLFLPLGGVWGDRFSRRRLLVASDVGRCATQLTFAFLLLSGNPSLVALAALQAVNGAADALFDPTATAVTPQTVSPARLQHANALISFANSAAVIAGPLTAGLLVTTVGPSWAIAVDGLTFLVSAAFLIRLRLPRRADEAPRQRFRSELAAGFREVRSRAWVGISIFDFMLFQVLVLAPFFVLGPLVAKDDLGGASAWAAIVTAMGVGAVLGDVAALRFEIRRPLVGTHLSAALVAPALVLLGLGAPLEAVAGAAVFLGVAFSMSNTLWYTSLHEHVPERTLARVSSYDLVGSSVLRPIGYAVVGPLAASVGVRATFVGAATMTLALQLAVASTPAVRAVCRRDPEESEPG